MPRSTYICRHFFEFCLCEIFSCQNMCKSLYLQISESQIISLLHLPDNFNWEIFLETNSVDDIQVMGEKRQRNRRQIQTSTCVLYVIPKILKGSAYSQILYLQILKLFVYSIPVVFQKFQFFLKGSISRSTYICWHAVLTYIGQERSIAPEKIINFTVSDF